MSVSSVDVSVLYDIVDYLEQHSEAVELKEPQDSEYEIVCAHACVSCVPLSLLSPPLLSPPLPSAPLPFVLKYTSSLLQ